ncbi:RCC1 domain-containing protein [Inhella proteolytica]|uniref:Alpha-tubulin suppressor-like RCC1 family protein n=1 Tax=Inhella proteolytica TaxID=2795029 RepID=A0A931J2M2_9BURK|nr:hypothetical protein [Inhella proteolytica]MBH9577030.1 hypothetical protein [Inhella proteolytica]
MFERTHARAWLALAASLALSACGGGEETPAEASPRIQSSSLIRSAAAAADSSVPPAEAARQLMNFGEQMFPAWFPGHASTQTFGPYLYRYYAESGNYLAVANGQVFVSGTSFGPALLEVGPITAFYSPVPGGSASMTTPSTGKTPWRVRAAAQFELRDGAGTLVAGPLSCSSDAPQALVVAADCSTLTGQRLGLHPVTVSNGSTSAKVMVKVIPVAQPLGQQGAATAVQMVVTVDGHVLAWGSNADGELGQGKSPSELPALGLPTPVKNPEGTGSLSGIVAVSAGEGAALALSEDGEVYSWGDNGSSKLGRSLTPASASYAALPGKVQGPTGSGTLNHIVSVSIGANNAIALRDDGTVFSWGGYAGHDDSASARKVPGIPIGLEGNGRFGPAVAISAGWSWNAVLLADGRVVTWGYSSNSEGNLGRPGSTAPYLPGLVVTAANGTPVSDIVALSAGYQHALALDGSGRAWAWGRGSSGQLGGGVNSSSPTFASLVKAPDGGPSLANVAMVAAGGNHSLALDQGGRVYSWGFATSGQLGDGANRLAGNGRNLPAPVVDVSGTLSLGSVAALAAGYDGSVALLRDGSVLAWGNGAKGALGQGASANPDWPVPLPVKNEAGNAALMLTPVSFWTLLNRVAR